MSTNGAPLSSTKSGGKSKLSQLKTHYRAATDAFLVRDYERTAISLDEAQSLLAVSTHKEDAWLTAVVEGREEPELDMARKLAILRITFLATVASSSPGSVESYPSSIHQILSLPSSALIPTLWHSLLPESDASSDILATPSAAFLHPSLVVALSLGALKVDQPAQARSVIESWHASMSESVEAVVWEEGSKADWEMEYSLSGEGMSSSGILSGPVKPGARRALLSSWVKAMDLQVLHVLPRLGEWEAAGDFVRLLGEENGGCMPDARVEAALAQLTHLQQQEALAATSRLERQRQQKEQQQLAIKSRSSSSRRDAKGKSRASPPLGSTSSSSSSKASPPPSPPKVRPTPPVEEPTGFASLRSSLSTYLSRPSSSPSTFTRLPVVGSLLKSLESDPVRLLSLLCALLAMMGWIRRRRRNGGLGLDRVRSGVSWGVERVFEAVKMGTKVTQL